MDHSRYHDAVVAKRREHGFDVVDEWTNGFDPVWAARDEDPTVGDVHLLATVVDGTDYGPSAVVETADDFRELLLERVVNPGGSTTPIGYVVVTVPAPDEALVERATSYTVAKRRTNVFPLVYDRAARRLHTHSIPRLKGRGIYRRQVDDAERLFDVPDVDGRSRSRSP
ncbi:hypothetical protein [Halorubrum sp. DTA98]|uniref:hypothetical protein n=1 Tax=Halorubrum sp. DTA98 TaxID=3402163 RepID=UPI003AAA6407